MGGKIKAGDMSILDILAKCPLAKCPGFVRPYQVRPGFDLDNNSSHCTVLHPMYAARVLIYHKFFLDCLLQRLAIVILSLPLLPSH